MHPNVDLHELDKFSRIAERWWDPNSEFRPLHQINPLRKAYIEQHGALAGQNIVDVGCGGGILSESLAQAGAQVLGIDLAANSLEVARLHALETGVPVQYRQISVEELAAEQPEAFDRVTCMEMLEHVPDPASVIAACARLVKPGGQVFFSTLNRSPMSYLQAILAAEYLLRLLPAGTHDYAKFIKPSELARVARANGLHLVDSCGVGYNPLTRTYRLKPEPDVNYLLFCIKPE